MECEIFCLTCINETKNIHPATEVTSSPNRVFALGYSNQRGYKIYGVDRCMDFKYNASINTSQVSFSAVYLIVTSDINSGIAISNKSHVLVIGIKISATTIFNAVISLGEGSLSAHRIFHSRQCWTLSTTVTDHCIGWDNECSPVTVVPRALLRGGMLTSSYR